MPHQQYDKAYKELFSNQEIFIQLIKSFLKETWVENIDENSLKTIDKSFILPDFSKKEADIIYRVNTKDGETSLYLYILLELQSTVDYHMPYRLLMYMAGVWQEHLKTVNKAETGKKSFKLPPVVPVVLYNGADNWTAARSFKEILTGYESYGRHILDFEYFLIDVNRCEAKILEEMGNIISSVFLIEQNRQTAGQLTQLLKKMIPVLENLPQEHFKMFLRWLTEVIIKSLPEPFQYQAIDYLNNTYQDKLEVNTLISNVTRTIEESLKTSWMEGKLEGKLEIARNLLLMGLSLKQIQEATGLDESEIIALKDKRQ